MERYTTCMDNPSIEVLQAFSRQQSVLIHEKNTAMRLAIDELMNGDIAAALDILHYALPERWDYKKEDHQ